MNTTWSVVIPAYNYAALLGRAIESVLAQAGPTPEIIVVDDGSTDETPAVAAGFGTRIRYQRQANAGPSAARNRGVSLATGDYLLFLDADDCLLPGALERFRRAVTDHSQAGFVIAGHETVGTDGRRSPSRPRPLSDDRTQNFCRAFEGRLGVCLSGSIVVRRAAFAADGLRFPEGLRNYEDRVLLAHLAARYNGVSLAEPTAEVFAHPGSLRHRLPEADFESRVLRALFDPAVLPPEFQMHRRAFATKLALSGFRRLYLAGRYQEATTAWRTALQHDARVLLRPRYLTKFVRASLAELCRAA